MPPDHPPVKLISCDDFGGYLVARQCAAVSYRRLGPERPLIFFALAIASGYGDR
jgi:hypothetical protein